ncbi:monoamine oxidase [Crossiella equi]|uniref:Monoamine oxidase n=1 Tax=Crossiella equi TaxID=130796 RepID=A0ABS5AA35_9PSEU|nr:FAD-dependent oxidoreductase [Crossiella equi]MBP2473142.1 monoamine oxidase [Crossiella equi]
MSTHTDIAVCGGGISGLYTAYQLKKRQPELQVSVYEATGRFGGKIQTVPMLGGAFHAEYGGVRVEPDLQTTVDAFVRELGLPVREITSHEAGSTGLRPALERLTEQERELATLHLDGDIALALLVHALETIVGDQWPMATDSLDRPGREQDRARFCREAVFDGKPLYQQGIWNVLAEVLSYEAVEFCREKGTFYNIKNQNQNAAEWIAQLLDMLLLEQPSYLPVGGMEALPRHVVEVLRTMGVHLHTGHRLITLTETADGERLTLGLRRADGETVEVTAGRVVLALPQQPLRRLASQLPGQVTRCLDAVLPFHMTWACCVVEDPWWDADTLPANGERTPVRAVHFEVSPDARHGMAMFYCDEPWITYWRNLVEDGSGELLFEQTEPLTNTGARLRRELERALRTTFDRTGTPRIVEWGIRDWSLPPYGGGAHLWQPGVDTEGVMHTLEAFSLGSGKTNVHICGEAYSTCQGFMEGALRSAERVLAAIDRDGK